MERKTWMLNVFVRHCVNDSSEVPKCSFSCNKSSLLGPRGNRVTLLCRVFSRRYTSASARQRRRTAVWWDSRWIARHSGRHYTFHWANLQFSVCHFIPSAFNNFETGRKLKQQVTSRNSSARLSLTSSNNKGTVVGIFFSFLPLWECRSRQGSEWSPPSWGNPPNKMNTWHATSSKVNLNGSFPWFQSNRMTQFPMENFTLKESMAHERQELPSRYFYSTVNTLTYTQNQSLLVLIASTSTKRCFVLVSGPSSRNQQQQPDFSLMNPTNQSVTPDATEPLNQFSNQSAGWLFLELLWR